MKLTYSFWRRDKKVTRSIHDPENTPKFFAKVRDAIRWVEKMPGGEYKLEG